MAGLGPHSNPQKMYDDLWADAAKPFTTPAGAEAYLFRAEDVKWLDIFPDVGAVMHAVESLYDAARESSAIDLEKIAYLRVGEEFGDIERIGDPDHFGLHVQQSVALPA
jgi:hypothetical protein